MFRFASFVVGILILCTNAFSQTLSGRVTDPVGKPLAQARLLLIDSSGAAVSTTRSDPQGRYRFEPVPAGVYRLFLRQSGFQQAQVEIRLLAGQQIERDLALQMEGIAEHVVVTATRTEAPASFVGNSVTVITAAEIEAERATSVAELLQSVPSLRVVSLGGRGSLTSLFVRGGESDYNKVLLDGIPINQPGGAVDLSSLSTANIERIEIVRGPQSALYGSDAISSVVQIFTRKGYREAPRPQFNVALEGGTFETFRGSAGLHGALGRLTYSAQFDHFETDNSEANDFFHNNTFSSHLGLQTSDRSTLELVTRLERGRSGVPGPTQFGPADREESYRKRDFLAGLRWTQQISENWNQRISYSHSSISQLSEDRVSSPPYVPAFGGRTGPFTLFDFPYSFLSSTRRHNLSYQSDVTWAAHLVTAGIDLESERGVVGGLRAERNNAGAYLQDEYLFRRRLALTGGVRLEHNGSFGWAAVPRVAAAWLARPGETGGFWGMTRPKFSFGLGIKEPSFIESYSLSPFFSGNPDLKPERTRSIEAGIEQRLASNRVRAEVNFFHNHFDDLIAYQTTNFTTFEGSFFNIASSRAWGFEHIVEARASDHLTLGGGYTYLNSRVLESTDPFDPVFARGARLLHRPTHSGSAMLNWTSGRWRVHSRATLVGSRADSDFLGLGLRQADAHGRVDLSAGYRVAQHAEVYAVFNNLLNLEYAEALGYLALKFNFRAGIKLSF